MEVPSLLNMASAIFILSIPFWLLHKQVIDLPTAIAVLGIALIIKLSRPITLSILATE